MVKVKTDCAEELMDVSNLVQARTCVWQALEKSIARVEEKEMSCRIPAALRGGSRNVLEFAKACLLEREVERGVMDSITALEGKVCSLSGMKGLKTCAMVLQEHVSLAASKTLKKCSSAPLHDRLKVVSDGLRAW